MKKPDVSVIIVSYNTKDLTLQTIRTLVDTTPLKLEVIVVDNNSSDGSAEAIKQEFPEIIVLEEKRNHGFGGGNNLGAQHATAEYLAFINSDIIANKSSLTPLIDYLKSNPDCGIAAPKIFLDDATIIQPASFGPEPTVAALLQRRQNKFDATVATNPTDTPQTVDWVTGAAFAISRELFIKLGGFDENIFMYFEDIDLCHRIRNAGYTIVWLPQSTLIHLGGRSTSSNKKRKQRYYEAQMYYTKKHYGSATAGLLWLLRLPIAIKETWR